MSEFIRSFLFLTTLNSYSSQLCSDVIQRKLTLLHAKIFFVLLLTKCSWRLKNSFIFTDLLQYLPLDFVILKHYRFVKSFDELSPSLICLK